MQPLFNLNPAVKSYEEMYLFSHSAINVDATLKCAIIKLMHYDIKISGIVAIGDVPSQTACLNIPVIHLDDLLPKKDRIAVIVVGSRLIKRGLKFMEYGFPNVFFDFMSETGALYIFGDEESDQLLELEG